MEGQIDMDDTSVTKDEASQGPQGQRYLAGGQTLSMRLWEAVAPGTPSVPVSRVYETVGYVIDGRAELVMDGQTIHLEPGSSWVVPRDAQHSYRFIEAFTAVEATSPPAGAHHLDAPPKG